ncbi:furin-like protease 2 isoform X2 [Hetaerina americana]|uniref:furin-like protease 2 isoform X2 n=1 Tax=Hetaerina americana TaxID=62018 RepID=UPI003A7F4BDD
MNVVPAWQRGYTGKGVVVSILDDGIQTNHPDLALNYDHLASTDINDNDDDPMPRDNGDNKHGTRCAGEVAGVAYNDYCGIGVAYNASIGGVRMLDGTVNDAVEARALGLNPEHIDIYSASWGPEDDGKTVDGPGPLARRAFIYGVTSGRKGKGSIFVWASGNGGRHTDSCNCDGYTNSIFTLSISSATQGGYKPWYLEECSSTLATTYSSGTPGHDKSVATVDMDAKLRPDRICTVEHTGTSASAPLAAGICALALEANPELTWRDMQYLVVLTSRSAPLEKESGWIVNGVKRKVSHKFGYGLMDAAAMVTLAEKWTTAPPQHICKSLEINENKEMQPIFGASLTVHMDVDGCHGTYNEVRFLEHVQCKISLRFFPRGNLRVALTSPMGTTSTLLFERPRDVISSNFDDWPFLSVHFWGERADGRWTLQILNGGSRHVNQPGILKKWQLIFYGTATDPIRLRSGAAGGRPGNHAGSLVAYPTAPSAPIAQGSSVIFGGTPTASFAGTYHNYQNVYSVSGSEKVEVSASPAKENSLEVGAVEGSVQDGKHILYDCDPQCDSQGCYGKGPAQCVTCKYYKLDGTCVSKCPPRSFPKAQFCWPCHESCETCAGAGQDSCLVCAPAHLRVTDLSVCLQQCPEGYLEDTEKSVCIPCESNCGSCQDKPDHCTSCDHHLVLYNNKCYPACPTYTYETGDYNCAPCHSSCETCNGSSETQCVSCRPGRFALSGTCLNTCPEGYYADKKRRECLECRHGCTTCDGPTCLTCTTGWILDSRRGRCMPPGSNQCDSAEYHDGGGGCRPCHSTCESCWGPTEDSCLACPSPLFLHQGQCLSTCPEKGVFPERGTCTPCPHTCVSCSSLHNCTQCVEGLHLQSGECRSTCADGYYSDRGVCAKCYLSCMTCSGPRRDQCVACPEGWQLAAGECHPECPEGYYKGEYGCQKCHHYCRTCKGEGPSNCSSCPPYMVLEKGLCKECFAWQYYDNRRKSCRACHISCRTCSGPGPVSCKSCALPLRFDRIDNQCVPCCTPEMNPPDCCHCDQGTGECLNYSSGGKRRTAAGADSGEAGAIVGEQDSPSLRVEPFATVTALAICGCATVVVLFGLIFTILQQVHSNCNSCWKQGYEKLPTRSQKEMTEKISLAEDEETLSDQDDDEEQLFTKT